MPSGKRSKAQRREASSGTPPPVRSKGGPRGPRQASPRTLAVAGGAIALIAIAVVLAIVFTRGGGSSAAPKDTPTIGRIDQNSLPGARQVQTLFAGIPQHRLVLGSASAPAKLVEYIDLQCPVCQAFETTILPTLVQKYVRPGKLEIVMKPGAIIGPDSVRGQQAAIAASFQNRAFNFAEMLYLNQQTENTGWLNDSMVAQAAASVPGLNVPKLFTQRSSAAAKSATQAVDLKLGSPGSPYDATPTILLAHSGRTPKVVSIGLPTLSTLQSQIDQAIAG